MCTVRNARAKARRKVVVREGNSDSSAEPVAVITLKIPWAAYPSTSAHVALSYIWRGWVFGRLSDWKGSPTCLSWNGSGSWARRSRVRFRKILGKSRLWSLMSSGILLVKKTKVLDLDCVWSWWKTRLCLLDWSSWSKRLLPAVQPNKASRDSARLHRWLPSL